MKTRTWLFLRVTVLASFLAITASAATQVYDLKTDWSDTHNPNGPWSLYGGGYLMVNNPFPWVSGLDPGGGWAMITQTTEATALPGDLEPGDIVLNGVGTEMIIRWTAPASGTICLSGALWATDRGFVPLLYYYLAHNNIFVQDGFSFFNFRDSPFLFSTVNAPVEIGDQIDLHLLYPSMFGINLTITFAAVNPVSAIENLAAAVVTYNLQNGIANSLDAKLNAALNALTDVNLNNDTAACNSLESFISAVEAQREKKITNAQADQIIGSAQEIKRSLGCTD